jgi:hypothetical protein
MRALNPSPAHFKFLKSRGLDGQAVRRALVLQNLFQVVERSSLRVKDCDRQRKIVVIDSEMADYLETMYPLAKSDDIDVGLPGLTSEPGRRRRHESEKHRKATERKAIRERILDGQAGLMKK